MTQLDMALQQSARRDAGDRHLARAKRLLVRYGDEAWAEGLARADALATAGDRHDAPTSKRNLDDPSI